MASNLEEQTTNLDDVSPPNESIEDVGDDLGSTGETAEQEVEEAAPLPNTPEEWQARIDAVQSQLDNAQSTIGRQGNQLGSQKDQIALYRDYLQTVQSGKPAGGEPADPNAVQQVFTEEEALQLLEDPHAALNLIAKRLLGQVNEMVDSRVSERATLSQQETSVREAFYAANSDLVNFEDIVGIAAKEVQISSSHLAPDRQTAMIADLARTKIARFRELTGEEGSTPKDTNGETPKRKPTNSRGTGPSQTLRRPAKKQDSELADVLAFVERPS